jgi:hypothetical protein
MGRTNVIYVGRNDLPNTSRCSITPACRAYKSIYGEDKVVMIDLREDKDTATVRVFLSELDLYNFEGDIDQAIAMFSEYKDPTYLKVELELEYGYGYDGESKNSLYVYGYRFEDPEESAARKAYEAKERKKVKEDNNKLKAAKVAAEQAEYERLKKKFEKS